jgi:hypothetical protein
MMAGIEPAVIGAAEAGKRSKLDHGDSRMRGFAAIDGDAGRLPVGANGMADKTTVDIAGRTVLRIAVTEAWRTTRS